MMEKLWKTGIYIFFFWQLMFLAFCSSYVSTVNIDGPPTVEQLDLPTNVSDSLPISLQKTARRSKQSSVALVALNMQNGEVSFASGTFIRYKDSLFILTAAHAVQQNAVIMAVTDAGQFPCGAIVYTSKESDIAIIESSDVIDRIPVNIEKAIPSYKKWSKSLESLDPVVYTGYPNATGPMTVQGKVMGFLEGVVFVNMYAWSGASGSGVFDEHGNLIGIVSALEIGDFGPVQIPLHSSIIVRPTYLVDWATVFEDY